MKTRNLVTILGMSFLLISVTSCNNTKNSISGTIQFNSSSKSAVIKSASVSMATGTVDIQTATVEIQNLVVEENSGNDVQNEGNNNDGKDNEKESTSTENDGGDVTLAGPYVLDVVNGLATIDQIDVQPGTYKKVDFDFVAGPENKGNSIVISGVYTSAGVATPFEITSNLAATVQLLLANSVNVNSESTVSVSIVFDVAGWLSTIDFENAILTVDKIIINANENASLYNSFVAALNQHIEAES